MKDLRVIILAAGEGKRLRPYTEDRPKSLVELARKPILQHQLDVLESAGIKDINIVSGYYKEKIEALGYKTFNNDKYDSTNMVASLMCARDCLNGQKDVLIAYADIAYERKVLDAIIGCDAEISTTIDKAWLDLWSIRCDNPIEYAETLKMDKDQNIIELGKKPNSLEEIEAQYMGLIKVKADFIPKILEIYDSLDRSATYDGKDFDNMYMTSFLQMVINQGNSIKAAIVNGGWLEVDTKEDLELYNKMQSEGALSKYYDMVLNKETVN